MERYPMRKKLVNEKRDELKSMPRTDFIDRICSYPNQALLNQDEEGVGRDIPVGKIAQGIRQMRNKNLGKNVKNVKILTSIKASMILAFIFKL